MPITREQQERVMEIVEQAMEHVQHLLFFEASVSHEVWQKDLRDILVHVYGDLHTRYRAKEQEYSEIASRYSRHEEFAVAANKYRDLADSCRQMANTYYIKAEYDEEVSSSSEMQNLAQFRENQIAENRAQMRALMQEALGLLQDDSVGKVELSATQQKMEIPMLLLSIQNSIARIRQSNHYQCLVIAYIERLLEITSPPDRSQAPA